MHHHVVTFSKPACQTCSCRVISLASHKGGSDSSCEKMNWSDPCFRTSNVFLSIL